MSRGLSSRLRQRVDIVRAATVATGLGGFTDELAPIAEGVAAEVIALTGGETVKERLFQGIRSYRITLRARAGVLQTDQVRHGGELLNIRSAIVDARARELVILADTEATLPGDA